MRLLPSGKKKKVKGTRGWSDCGGRKRRLNEKGCNQKRKIRG